MKKLSDSIGHPKRKTLLFRKIRGLIVQKKWVTVDAVSCPGVLIPQVQAGGFHGQSIELPSEKACY